MAEHNLFLGGDCPDVITHKRNMLPSTEPARDARYFDPAAHKGGINRFVLNRKFDFLGCKTLGGKFPVQESGADPAKPIWNQGEKEFGSVALEQYLRDNTIAVDDIINAIIIPADCIVTDVLVEVHRPVDGATFDVEIRNGTVDDPAPIALTSIDGADGELYEHTVLETPFFSGRYNDMVRLLVTGLPDDPAALCELSIEVKIVLDHVCVGSY